MSSSLSKRWVCVVENLCRVFLSEWSLYNLWVMKEYIVWVKGKKVILKNPLGRKSCGYLARRPYPWNIHEIDNLTRLFSFQSCASHMLFMLEPFSWTSREIVAKCTNLYLSLSLHKLNTKPNKIPQNIRNKIKTITILFVME